MNEKKYKDNSKENKIIILLLLLIILILILFFFIRKIGMIDNKPETPTGNVDIFDINFVKNCNCDCDVNNKDSNNACTNCNNGIPVSGTVGSVNNNISDGGTTNSTNKDIEEGLSVFDKDTVFSTNTTLNIFTQKSYNVVNDKIAPTSENSYQFIIRNNNNFNIKYSLEMFETNKYNINMKYRLKLNGKYVVGNDDKYVSSDELAQYDIKLSNNNYNVYTLDWKWIESSNDTQIGTNITSNYKLELKISASVY